MADAMQKVNHIAPYEMKVKRSAIIQFIRRRYVGAGTRIFRTTTSIVIGTNVSPVRMTYNNAPARNDTSWYGRCLGFHDLYNDEGNEENAEERKECNNASVAPGVGAAAPLQPEQEAYEGGKQEKLAKKVQLAQLLANR